MTDIHAFLIDVSLDLNHGDPNGPQANVRMLVEVEIDLDDYELDIERTAQEAITIAKDKLRPFLNNSTHFSEAPFMLVDVHRA